MVGVWGVGEECGGGRGEWGVGWCGVGWVGGWRGGGGWWVGGHSSILVLWSLPWVILVGIESSFLYTHMVESSVGDPRGDRVFISLYSYGGVFIGLYW